MINLQMKRIYEPASSTDGFRVLADRLWPRGIKKEDAKIDLWVKGITPTAPLREAFHRGDILWQEFKEKYRLELLDNPALDSFVETIQDRGTVTLLFAGKDADHTHVKVMVDVLKQKLQL